MNNEQTIGELKQLAIDLGNEHGQYLKRLEKLEKENERLKEYIDQLEHEKQLLYGRLNMIRDLTEKEIK